MKHCVCIVVCYILSLSRKCENVTVLQLVYCCLYVQELVGQPMYAELVEGENSNDASDAVDAGARDRTVSVGIRKLLIDVSCCCYLSVIFPSLRVGWQTSYLLLMTF